jgi:hypothetical protein
MRKIQLPFERDKAETAGEVDFFYCYVSGEPWRYARVTKEQMRILSDGVSMDAEGLCDGRLNTIYITEGSVDHPTVLHELMHAHFNQAQVHSAHLTDEQVEEVMCDIFAYNWCRMLLLARLIVHNLLCYEDYLAGNKEQEWIECPADVINGHVAEHLNDLVATYTVSGGANPLLKAGIAKKKRPNAGPKKKLPHQVE